MLRHLVNAAVKTYSIFVRHLVNATVIIVYLLVSALMTATILISSPSGEYTLYSSYTDVIFIICRLFIYLPLYSPSGECSNDHWPLARLIG